MMHSRSSTVLGDTPKMENLMLLLRAAGQVSSVGPDEAPGLKEGSHQTTHFITQALEGAYWKEQYCILVQIKTARDKKPLQFHAWVEGLLQGFTRTICMRRIQWSCEGLTSVHNEYTGYTLKHLLLRQMYNLPLPILLCYAQALRSETSYCYDC